MNTENNTAQQPATPVAPVTKSATKEQEIESSRSFRIVERKDFSIAPAGTFNATLRSLAFIGTYTREFTQNNKTITKAYEMVGMVYNFLDLNTGQQSEIFTECVLSYHPDSRLNKHINALTAGAGLKEGDGLKNLVGKHAKITIIHRPSADGDKTYANISLVEPADQGASFAPITEGHFFYFDILTDMGKIDDLNTKHRWLIENKSHEYGDATATASPASSQQSPQQEQPPIPDEIPA